MEHRSNMCYGQMGYEGYFLTMGGRDVLGVRMRLWEELSKREQWGWTVGALRVIHQWEEYAGNVMTKPDMVALRKPR